MTALPTEAPSESQRKLISDPILLETPIPRGDTTIDSIQLRRPDSGALRGISLVQLGQMQVDEIRKLLPRISVPTLSPWEVDKIDPADLMEIANEMGDFLLTKARRVDSPTA